MGSKASALCGDGIRGYAGGWDPRPVRCVWESSVEHLSWKADERRGMMPGICGVGWDGMDSAQGVFTNQPTLQRPAATSLRPRGLAPKQHAAALPRGVR